jgi:hypothetical protein
LRDGTGNDASNDASIARIAVIRSHAHGDRRAHSIEDGAAIVNGSSVRERTHAPAAVCSSVGVSAPRKRRVALAHGDRQKH